MKIHEFIEIETGHPKSLHQYFGKFETYIANPEIAQNEENKVKKKLKILTFLTFF